MRPITLSSLIAVLLFCFATPVWAQDDVNALLSPEYFACLDNPDNMTTLGMVQCMQAETERQDAKLNAAYQRLMPTLSAEKQAELREAQRAWIKFRDTYGTFLYDLNGGSIDRLNTAGWYMRSTALQARELGYLLNDAE